MIICKAPTMWQAQAKHHQNKISMAYRHAVHVHTMQSQTGS